MAKIVTVEQMRQIEIEADKNGLSFQSLMKNAGKGLAEEISKIAHRYYSGGFSVLGLVGPGNNGGDTLIAVTLLAKLYSNVTGYILYKKKDQQELIDELIENGGDVVYLEEDSSLKGLISLIEESEILVDGILGTGFRLPLHKDIKKILSKTRNTLNEMEIPPIIIAVDCPSGIDNDTGESADETISADFTICMAAVKQGLIRLPAFKSVGKIILVDIGLTAKNSSILEIKNEVASDDLVRSYKKLRPLDSHKGTFGTSLIVAGSSSYTGAALLAGKAAYRVGSGLVTMAVPSMIHGTLAGHLPEATWILLPHEMGSISESASNVLVKYLEKVDSMLIGCGLGTEDTTYEFMKSTLSENSRSYKDQPRIGFVHNSEKKVAGKKISLPPLVIDADGLKLLKKIPDWQKVLPENSILTPHPGEMEVLTGISIENIQEDRINIASRFAMDWNQVIVLKGAFTVVASPDGSTTTIPVATPALAHAGTGDVLAGMITGFLAQGMTPLQAAISGAWYHAQAGLIAAEKIGCTDSVLASDILDVINESLSSDSF